MRNDVIEVRLILSASCTCLVEKLNLRREIRNPLWISPDRTYKWTSDSRITTEYPELPIRLIKHQLKFPLRRVHSFAPQRIDLRARHMTLNELNKGTIPRFEELPTR